MTTPLRMLSADDKHAEIKRLYYETTRQTIQQDLAKALDLRRDARELQLSPMPPSRI